MVILRTRNKITDFLMILAWASPFKYILDFSILTTDISNHFPTITKLKIRTRSGRLKNASDM